MGRFIPDGDSRRETAVLLTGTRDEFGLHFKSVKAVQGGFEISDELAGILDEEKPKKTSGDRAAKKKNEE